MVSAGMRVERSVSWPGVLLYRKGDCAEMITPMVAGMGRVWWSCGQGVITGVPVRWGLGAVPGAAAVPGSGSGGGAWGSGRNAEAMVAGWVPQPAGGSLAVGLLPGAPASRMPAAVLSAASTSGSAAAE